MSPSSTLAASIGKSPRCSQAVTSTLVDGPQKGGPRSAALENYLNDMKRFQKARGAATGTPSPWLQKMNDERVKLPSERRAERQASNNDLHSNDADASELPSAPPSARVRRSVSCGP